MELILVRHGESLHNIKAVTSWDSELSIIGKEQVRLVGEVLLNELVDEIWCSPMQRALETAQILSSKTQASARAFVHLSEHGYGWEENGLSLSFIENQYPLIRLPSEIDEDGWARHWNHETRSDLYRRMGYTADQIIKVAASKRLKKLVVVIHGKSGTELLKHLLQIPEEAKYYFRMFNCGITRLYLNIETNERTVICMNDISHLGDLVQMKNLSRSVPRYR